MSLYIIALVLTSVVFLLVKYFNRTDVARVKALPEIPGVPIFGNLLQLGSEHARNAGKWAKTHGAVFQVRLGNKVGFVLDHYMSYR